MSRKYIPLNKHVPRYAPTVPLACTCTNLTQYILRITIKKRYYLYIEIMKHISIFLVGKDNM